MIVDATCEFKLTISLWKINAIRSDIKPPFLSRKKLKACLSLVYWLGQNRWDNANVCFIIQDSHTTSMKFKTRLCSSTRKLVTQFLATLWIPTPLPQESLVKLGKYGNKPLLLFFTIYVYDFLGKSTKIPLQEETFRLVNSNGYIFSFFDL